MIGSLPVRVTSFGGRNFFTPENAHHMQRIGPNEKGETAYCTWADPHRHNPFDGIGDIFDNHGSAILEYAGGVRGTFHLNCNAGTPERRFYVCGTGGNFAGLTLPRTRSRCGKSGGTRKSEKTSTFVEAGHGGGDEVMARAMVETLLRGATPLASYEEGLASAIVAFGIDRAADEGCVVDLAPIWRQAGFVVELDITPGKRRLIPAPQSYPVRPGS